MSERRSERVKEGKDERRKWRKGKRVKPREREGTEKGREREGVRDARGIKVNN